MSIRNSEVICRFSRSSCLRVVCLCAALSLGIADFASAQEVDDQRGSPTFEAVRTAGDVADVEVSDEQAAGELSKLWANLIPVVAAFGGAALTFLATQLTDKKNWERAQRDSLRNRQFEKISNAARALSKATDSFTSVEAAINDATAKTPKSKMMNEAAILRFVAKAKDWKVEVDAAHHQLRYAEIELELVGVPDELLLSLADAIDGIMRLSEQLDVETQASDQFPVEVIGQTLNSIRGSSSSFVAAARSFHGAHYG